MLQARTGPRRGGDGTSSSGRRFFRRSWPVVTRAVSWAAPPVLGVLGLVAASLNAPGLLFLHAGLAPEPVSAGMLTARVLPVVGGVALSGLGIVLGARRPGPMIATGAVFSTLGLLLLLTPYAVLSHLPAYSTYLDLVCCGMLLLLGVLEVATGLACLLTRSAGTPSAYRDPFVPVVASVIVFGVGLVAVLAGLGRWWDVVLSAYHADLSSDTLVLVLGGSLLLVVAVLLASLHWSAGITAGLLAGVLPGLFLLYSSSRDSRPLRSRLPAQVATGYHLSVGVPVLVGVLVVASGLAVLVARRGAGARA